jgi:hypothetical protein
VELELAWSRAAGRPALVKRRGKISLYLRADALPARYDAMRRTGRVYQRKIDRVTRFYS